METTLDIPTNSSEEQSPSQNVNRSCEGCRGRKIRCQPQENKAQCIRCEKMRLSCVYLPPVTRQRRKRVDVRVAELEKELKHMRKRLDDQDHRHSGADRSSSESSDVQPTMSDQTGLPPQSMFSSTEHDLFELTDVNDLAAAELFNDFSTALLPHFPLIDLSPETSIQELKQKLPTLYLAILTASANTTHPSLGKALSKHLETTFADLVFIKSEKSIELIQSLLITAIWYPPPGKFKELKFTQYAHTAANMCLDIHIGMGVSSDAARSLMPENSVMASYPNKTILESRRTYISCYLLCASMAMALRRPNMVKYSQWTAECIRCLTVSPVAQDHKLATWATLQHLAEEALITLGLDDYHFRADMSDPRIQSTLRALNKQLIEWKNGTIWDDVSPSLKVHFHYLRLKLHEIALHVEFDPEEFTPPYLMRMRPVKPKDNTSVSPAHIEALMICVQAAHAVLDAFLSLDTAALRAIPVIAYTRMFYAIVVLTKLATSARTSKSCIGSVLHFDDLKINSYLGSLTTVLKVAAGEEKIAVPTTFLSILLGLTAWYERQHAASNTPAAVEELLEPMAHLNSPTTSPEYSDTTSTMESNAVQAGTHSTASTNLELFDDGQLLNHVEPDQMNWDYELNLFDPEFLNAMQEWTFPEFR